MIMPKAKTTIKKSDFLSELRNKSLESRSNTPKLHSQLPDQQKKILKKKTTPVGVSFYDRDLSVIREVQHFFFSKGKTDSSVSKIIRCALRLASSTAKENEYLLLSIYQEVEDEDARKNKNL